MKKILSIFICSFFLMFPTPSPAHADNIEIAQSKKLITILVADWCGYCRRLESWLKSEEISYNKLNIERDAQGVKEYNRLGRGPIPITIIGNEIIRGFNKAAITEAHRKERLKYGLQIDDQALRTTWSRNGE
jgi:glutaredoxin